MGGKAGATKSVDACAENERRRDRVMPVSDWLRINVELVSGLVQRFDPPPGRVFLVSPRHAFAQPAEAIDVGFARWDRSSPLFVQARHDLQVKGKPR